MRSLWYKLLLKSLRAVTLVPIEVLYVSFLLFTLVLFIFNLSSLTISSIELIILGKYRRVREFALVIERLSLLLRLLILLLEHLGFKFFDFPLALFGYRHVSLPFPLFGTLNVNLHLWRDLI